MAPHPLALFYAGATGGTGLVSKANADKATIPRQRHCRCRTEKPSLSAAELPESVSCFRLCSQWPGGPKANGKSGTASEIESSSSASRLATTRLVAQ